jgi:exodeoxyribonuclease V gamma subunit
MKTFFSNRVEELYEFFRKELYLNNNHAFAERLIVVPSPAVKNWLTLKLADDPAFCIAMGIKMGFLDQTLKNVSSFSRILPSRQTLSFTIEALLDKKWKKGELDSSVEQYLGDPSKRRGQKRLVQIADALASLFERYGIYAPKMVEKWEQDPSMHWQAGIWNELFSGDWSYPAAMYNEDQYRLKPNTSIHLFSISYISEIHHRFLQRLSEQIPVSYYILSPCQTFWSDILTDREAGRLEAYWRHRGVAEGEQRALEEYLSDRNPLLANYGCLGRSMAKLFESGEVSISTAYAYSASIEEEYQDYLFEDPLLVPSGSFLTLLEGVQADIGLMRNPEDGLLPNINPCDDSIQIHSAPTKLREVEVVRDIILRAVEIKGFLPEEVLVMAPDISSYTAVLESVLGRAECPLDYQLLDVGKIAGNQEIRLLLELLNLPMTRWDVISIISLIENGVGFSKEEAEIIVPWLRTTGVRWGYDKEDREELLNRDHGDCRLIGGKNRGTWNDALSKLVRSMVLEENEELDSTFDFISTSEGDLLGKFITFVREIRHDLLPLTTGKNSIIEWLENLELIIHKYLKISDETKEYLFQTFEEIRRSSVRMNQLKVPFYSLKCRLQKAFEKKESGYRETHLSAVRFCSMLPMRAIPAKMIVLMGMDEHSFPKKEPFSNLDQMRSNRELCEEMPSQVDYDRFLFLESILSARETLVITYVSHASGESKEIPPSVVVTELVDYIQKAFSFNIQTINHPFNSFHHSLFTQESALKSYSQRDYQFATIYYKKESKSTHVLDSPIRSMDKNTYIDTDHFQKCLQNPLRNYLRTNLQIKIPKEKETISEEEAFEVDGLQTYQISKMGLRYDPEQLYRMIHDRDILPAGVFGDLAKKRLEIEIRTISENKRSLGLTNNSFFDLVFTDEVKKPKREGDQWMLPPLPFGDKVCLTGSLSDCTEKGIWVHSSLENARSIGKGMGKYLMYMHAIRFYNLPFEPKILFGKSGVEKELDLSLFESHRKSAEELFLKSQNKPCHLFVDWIDHILKKDEKKLTENISQTEIKAYDEYAAWYIRNREVPTALDIIDECYEDAEAIYGTAYRNWIGKKAKNEEL